MKLITAALIAAKAKFTPIHKNKINPHFNFKTATVRTTSSLPSAGERATVNREVELRKLMTDLNLPARTVTELVQRHFGIDRRINSMTPAEFTQLLNLMRQTANLEANNNHQTNGVAREKVRA